jgi:hypothetical protein
MLSSNHWDIFSLSEWLLFVLWFEVTVAIYCLEHTLSIDTVYTAAGFYRTSSSYSTFTTPGSKNLSHMHT